MFNEKTFGVNKPAAEKKAIIARAVWKIEKQPGAIPRRVSSPISTLKWSDEDEHAEQVREWKILQELCKDAPHIRKKFERFEAYED